MVIDFGTFYDLPTYMEKFFEDMWHPSVISQRRLGYPPLNISDTEEAVVIRAEIPGVAMEDLELTLSEKSLTISGERKAAEGRYFRQERPAGPFQRIVTVNVPVEREGVKATLKNGILEIRLPKADSVKPKKIDIKVS